MDIFTIEKSSQQLLKDINSGLSGRQKLFRLNEYYEQVRIHLTAEAQIPFIIEFIPHYTKAINEFRPFGLHPDIIKKVIDSANKILQLNFVEEYRQTIKSGLQKIEKEYSSLIKSLHGEAAETNLHPKIIFPVLKKLLGRGDIAESSCFLETVTITIQKTQSENKFTVTPGERKTDELLLEQINTSWQLAVEYSGKYTRKINRYHNVVVKFDSEAGTYTGNSLGIALTIGFIQEILQFYNAPYLTNIKSGIASTGSVDSKGKINSVSKEQIQKKSEAVFYSNLNTFVIPEVDKGYAFEKLAELQKEFPKRNLKVIGAEQLSDVFNRRDLVEIKKQPVIVRSGKIIKKNWVAFSLLLIIMGMVYFAGWWDFDTNPSILKNERDWLYVQNKNGKELLRKKMKYDITMDGYSSYPSVAQKLVDINKDGVNEILLTEEYRIQDDTTYPRGRVVCYSSKGSVSWEYYFRDSTSSIELDHSTQFQSRLIDTLTIDGTKSIVLFSVNNLYPSAIYFLELSSGNRIGPTIWHVGHLHSGKIGDFNKDGELELIMSGINNALGRSVIFSIDVSKITDAQLPAEGVRLFKNLKFARVNKYILLPQSDYDKYYGNKFNFAMVGSLSIKKNLNEISLFLFEGSYENKKAIYVQCNNELNVSMIDPSENFEVARDSLVVRGELLPPYTHTPEFINSLWEQLRYWDGERFIKIEALE